MGERQFTTPQDAERAFYEALEQRNLKAMMTVWAEEEKVVCIHPGGPRLTGPEQVRESWRQVFASETRLTFELQDQHYFQGAMLSIHIVHEKITVAKEDIRALVIATNVYLLTGRGWKMILHHASLPPHQAAGPAPDGDNRTLH